MPTIKIYHDEGYIETEAYKGQNALELLISSGVYINAPCGGHGKCGKCLIETLDVRDSEVRGEDRGEIRLACETCIYDDLIIRVKNKITPSHLFVKNKAAYITGLGVAADIGSTTITASLCDLKTGEILASISEPNNQAVYGADIITRLEAYCKDKAGILTMTVRGQINRLIKELCLAISCKMSDISYVTIAGNTIMQHIFAGYDASGILSAPFVPYSLFGEEYKASEFNIEIKKEAGIFIMPAVSAFIGGDLVAGLLIYNEYDSILVDLGTNAEIALITEKGIYACSAAAGPALEGMEISCGTGACAGSIDKIWLYEGDILYETIKSEKPIGLCASGLADAICVMLKSGALDKTGRLKKHKYVSENKDIFNIGESGIYVSGTDIRAYMLAAAAISAGIETLIKTAGYKKSSLKKIYLTGGLGSHINPQSAVITGLIPNFPVAKIEYGENGAGMGAVRALCGHRERAVSLSKEIKYIELSGNDYFDTRYIKNMRFNLNLMKNS